jgi:hypothetical protein
MKIGFQDRSWTLAAEVLMVHWGPNRKATGVNENGNEQNVCLHVRIGVSTWKEQSRLRVCVVSVGAITVQHTFWSHDAQMPLCNLARNCQRALRHSKNVLLLSEIMRAISSVKSQQQVVPLKMFTRRCGCTCPSCRRMTPGQRGCSAAIKHKNSKARRRHKERAGLSKPAAGHCEAVGAELQQQRHTSGCTVDTQPRHGQETNPKPHCPPLQLKTETRDCKIANLEAADAASRDGAAGCQMICAALVAWALGQLRRKTAGIERKAA